MMEAVMLALCILCAGVHFIAHKTALRTSRPRLNSMASLSKKQTDSLLDTSFKASSAAPGASTAPSPLPLTQFSLSDPSLSFQVFQRRYLIVYLLASGADWLQGPYVYALYAHYGFDPIEISRLYVAGFASALIFGTVLGSFADRFGRKVNCCLYCFMYIISCLTKHSNQFNILLLGRISTGIGTSILHTAFETWLVHEHNRHKFDTELLDKTFSICVFANSCVAILAGFVGNLLVKYYGVVAPFDAAIVLLLGALIFLRSWTENYGDNSSSSWKTFSKAFSELSQQPSISILGSAQALYEGAMYVFVFSWTPALDAAIRLNAKISAEAVSESSAAASLNDATMSLSNHGLVFSAFMIGVMIGSGIFSILTNYGILVKIYIRFVFMAACGSLLLVICSPSSQTLVFIGFVSFEIATGVFWPSMSALRRSYIPADTRATIMNMFRVPLNFVAIVILLQNFDSFTALKMCVALVALGACLAQILKTTPVRRALKVNSLKSHMSDVDLPHIDNS